MNHQPPSHLTEDLITVLSAAPGRPPAPDALDALGGWERLATDGAAVTDPAIIGSLVALVVRDAGNPDKRVGAYPDAVCAIVTAITAIQSPAAFAVSLNTILSSAPALAVAGDDLATSLGEILQDFRKLRQTDRRVSQRAADALEGLTRLNLMGIGSPYILLAILDGFDAPLPQPLGTAVIRAIGVAVDHWPHAAPLTRVVRQVAGLDKPKGAPYSDADTDAVASDAAWVLAGIELVGALRADLPEMAAKLQIAAGYLATARQQYGREDAEVLLAVIEILLALLGESGVAPTYRLLNTPKLDLESLEWLAKRLHGINVTSIGLNHWYGDPKRAALLAWHRLANDLGRLRAEFARSSFYRAEIVVDHLLQIYIGSRSIEVVRRDDDLEGILQLVQPIIETGFARTAGLRSNLADHTAALEERVAEATTGEERRVLAEQLEVSRSVLAAAQSHALGGAGEGKGGGGTAATPLPPPLDQLVPPGSPEAILLASMDPAVLAVVARSVDDRTIGRRSLNLTEYAVFVKLRTALAKSQDYQGEPAEAVDELLRLIIRFVSTRNGAQSDLFGYLYDPSAVERAIHLDLYNYLISTEVGSLVEYEVQHVAGGRIDLRLKFDGFAIHIEMKVDSSKIPISDKTSYLKQAAAYQINDVRIGFLIALRHAAFDPTGPPPHLTELLGHVAFDIDGDPEPRHIVTVQLPGSRTKPSAMR